MNSFDENFNRFYFSLSWYSSSSSSSSSFVFFISTLKVENGNEFALWSLNSVSIRSPWRQMRQQGLESGNRMVAIHTQFIAHHYRSRCKLSIHDPKVKRKNAKEIRYKNGNINKKNVRYRICMFLCIEWNIFIYLRASVLIKSFMAAVPRAIATFSLQSASSKTQRKRKNSEAISDQITTILVSRKR